MLEYILCEILNFPLHLAIIYACHKTSVAFNFNLLFTLLRFVTKRPLPSITSSTREASSESNLDAGFTFAAMKGDSWNAIVHYC